MAVAAVKEYVGVPKDTQDKFHGAQLTLSLIHISEPTRPY